ncbi:3-hydroxyacyl-CoA dehydrogenase family protein [Niabella soli]|uniref:3-hydroxyacyl-CoA dehydrogenase n=1 Tax=Niabella soli DSM 19437 TaxID=929713 RepID=W0F339_9BACT|nr:3-hydroxyacyl-CoA dehydrogenase family protein [Niabella soli]AHF16198.1 3-hydroxyacyl-CoA dehydrogenase [Niabella soli DSM 19437]
MRSIKIKDTNIGVVGLGLMGTSFITTLLMTGHKVIAIAPLTEDMEVAPERINNQLLLCEKTGLLKRPVEAYLSQLVISENYELLGSCDLVVECVIEHLEIKKGVYKKVESVVWDHTIIASNTSAIPISELQKDLIHPERFLGIHWAEPSYFTRFMEVTLGENTAPQYAQWVYELAHYWGKEPTLLRKDIRGFITNRLMYAVYREGLNIVQSGQATLEDIDKAFRYDAGSWMTLMGVFRRMDYLGLKDYAETFKAIFPALCNDEHVPALMQRMVDINARGVQNLSGLYQYSAEEAKKWEEAFILFNEEIYRLAAEYPLVKENIPLPGV